MDVLHDSTHVCIHDCTCTLYNTEVRTCVKYMYMYVGSACVILKVLLSLYSVHLDSTEREWLMYLQRSIVIEVWEGVRGL